MACDDKLSELLEQLSIDEDKIGFFQATAVAQPAHNADPAAMASITATGPAKTAANPDALTGVSMGDLGATNSSPWGFSSEANADKITTAVDQLIADVLSIHTQLTAAIADIDANNAQIDALIVDVGAAKTAVDANNAAIDAINADMATLGLTASS